MWLKPNTLLQGGKYIIIRTLGQGGFGITYEAEQVNLGRKVAIKEFFMKDCCERNMETSHVTVGTGAQRDLVEKFRGKFVREAKMIASLEHPHIVRVLDVFEENDTAYYVMENLPGGSLSDKVKKEGRLSESHAEKYIRQVADALAYIHSRDTVHLDVKPSNILLNSKGDAVMIDFGISKHYDEAGEQTSSTPVGISKGFAPLEQSRDGDVSQFKPSTDIYALGATLYYLVTGKVPPEATIVNEDGLDRPGGLSDRIWRVIDKSMQPRRKDRPQTIEEFLKLFGVAVDKESAKGSEDEEVTVIRSKPANTRPKERKPVLKDPVNVAAITPESHPQEPGASKPWVKYGIIGGVVSVLVLFLLLFLPRGKKSVTDSLTINGTQNCTVEVESAGTNLEFIIEKSFKERWSYSGVPEWCIAKAEEGKLLLIVSENKSKDERTAKIVFRKKDVNAALAYIALSQKAGEVAKKNGSSVKEVGSVRFASTPSGATIWLDGKNTQKKTPAIIEGITVGQHSIYLVLDGYETHEGMITVTSKKRGVLDRTLKKESADAAESQSAVIDPKKNNPNYQEVFEDEVEESIPFQLVEVKPSFQGGDANEFSKWVNSQLVYPEEAKENGIQGRVTLQFTVEADGRVTNVKVLRGVDALLDAEALRVVRHSPRWTPGRQRDRLVRVTYTFPIIFQLN